MQAYLYLSEFRKNINKAFAFQIPLISLSLGHCVNATEFSFLTLDWCQIRSLCPFTKVFVRIRQVDLNHTRAGSEVNAKITVGPQGKREVAECLWISLGVWTRQVWRVSQLMALGIHSEMVSKSCAVFTSCDNKSLCIYLAPVLCTHNIFFPLTLQVWGALVWLCFALYWGKERSSVNLLLLRSSEFALVQEQWICSCSGAVPWASSHIPNRWCSHMCSELLCRYFPCLARTVGISL